MNGICESKIIIYEVYFFVLWVRKELLGLYKLSTKLYLNEAKKTYDLEALASLNYYSKLLF